MIVSAVQWSESAVCIHIPASSWTSLPLPWPHPTLWGHHRALSWGPWATQQLPTRVSDPLPAHLAFLTLGIKPTNHLFLLTQPIIKGTTLEESNSHQGTGKDKPLPERRALCVVLPVRPSDVGHLLCSRHPSLSFHSNLKRCGQKCKCRSIKQLSYVW